MYYDICHGTAVLEGGLLGEIRREGAQGEPAAAGHFCFTVSVRVLHTPNRRVRAPAQRAGSQLQGAAGRRAS